MCYRRKFKVNVKRRLGEDKLPPEWRMPSEEVLCMNDRRRPPSTLLAGLGCNAVTSFYPDSSSLRELIFCITALEHRNPLESWN